MSQSLPGPKKARITGALVISCWRSGANSAMAEILVCLSGARSFVRPGALRFGALSEDEKGRPKDRKTAGQKLARPRPL
jgi:hypothetical protein